MKAKMKSILKIIIVSLIGFIMISSIFGVGGNGQGLRDGSGTGQGMGRGMHSQGGYVYEVYDDTNVNHEAELALLPIESLSEDEISSLIYMREEEKLARDVYLQMYDIYGMQIFSNIARSEDKHTSAIESLLVRYDIEDPVKSDERGVFINQDLKSLYDSLIAKGSINLSEALVVGATIEDLDIKDLQDDLLVVDNSDITLVYENLEKGSRNHLRSFTKTLERNSGIIYSPIYISEEYYSEIVSSDMEKGSNYGSDKNFTNRRGVKNNLDFDNVNSNSQISNQMQSQNSRSENENNGFFGKFFGGFKGFFN